MQRLVQFVHHDRPVGVLPPFLADELALAVVPERRLGDQEGFRQLVLADEAGVKVYIISHVASGPFTADRFEREMQANAETMIRALVVGG